MNVQDHTDERISVPARRCALRAIRVQGHARLFSCNTMTASSLQDKSHHARLSCKQMWRCPMCGAGCRTKFGVIADMLMGKQLRDANAKIPLDQQDMKACMFGWGPQRQDKVLLAIPEVRRFSGDSGRPASTYSANTLDRMALACFPLGWHFRMRLQAPRGRGDGRMSRRENPQCQRGTADSPSPGPVSGGSSNDPCSGLLVSLAS